MNQISFSSVPLIIAGLDSARHLPDHLGKRPLIITDKGLRSTGIPDRIFATLKASGAQPFIFDGVEADPHVSVVHSACAVAAEQEIDSIVGLGGGSSMDVAKLVATLGGTPPLFETIYGIGQIGSPRRLRLVQMPTTAGTGSEVTQISIVTTETGEKKGIVSAQLMADVAILDGALTLGLPAHVTAATGIDAMVHAIEAYTSKILKNPVSDALSVKSLALLSKNIRSAVNEPNRPEPRQNMLLGAMLAGMAFANAPVGGVHALAYPIGGLFHVPHGLSNALVLIEVLRFNLPVAGPLYAELGSAIGVGNADAFINHLVTLMRDVGLESGLQSVGIGEGDLPRLVAGAMNQQRLLVNNPVEIDSKAALSIYRAAL